MGCLDELPENRKRFLSERMKDLTCRNCGMPTKIIQEPLISRKGLWPFKHHQKQLKLFIRRIKKFYKKWKNNQKQLEKEKRKKNGLFISFLIAAALILALSS